MNIANQGLFNLTQEEEATAYQALEAPSYPHKKLNLFNSNSTNNQQFGPFVDIGNVAPRNQFSEPRDPNLLVDENLNYTNGRNPFGSKHVNKIAEDQFNQQNGPGNGMKKLYATKFEQNDNRHLTPTKRKNRNRQEGGESNDVSTYKKDGRCGSEFSRESHRSRKSRKSRKSRRKDSGHRLGQDKRSASVYYGCKLPDGLGALINKNTSPSRLKPNGNTIYQKWVSNDPIFRADRECQKTRENLQNRNAKPVPKPYFNRSQLERKFYFIGKTLGHPKANFL